MVPAEQLERFKADLDALIEPGTPFGIAVSGGPDSLALLLLAFSARPGEIAAATVDHGLRPESRDEAEAVADICEQLGVPHAVLAVEWDIPSGSAIQEKARQVRYGVIAAWMKECGLSTLTTAHHIDDQAETLVMRLNRGAGVRGLSGMRPLASVPDHPDLRLARPLLGWRHAELAAVCAAAGVAPFADPSNEDDRHERVRIRRALSQADWLDAEAVARSASNLAEADDAIEWAAAMEWTRFAAFEDGGIIYRPSSAPGEIVRRIVARAIEELGTEGEPDDLRGRELDRLIGELEAGRTATLRGVRCQGGAEWRFAPARPRRA
jgi:tRNA(Ile)-lysidine synthase